MRLFVAVPVPDEVRARVGELIAALRSGGADCKWTDPGLLHLTLAFLGETPPARLPEVERAVEAAARRPAFPVALGGLGGFPSLERPRVLWLGVREGGAELAAAAAGLRPAYEPPFHPHLTLGRLRSSRGLEGLRRRFAEAERLELPSFAAERLVLYQSRLGAAGPAHTPLAERPLGRA